MFTKKLRKCEFTMPSMSVLRNTLLKSLVAFKKTAFLEALTIQFGF